MDDPSNGKVLERELNSTQRTAIMAILTASAIATNYILIGVVNVKLMDLIVFTAGYLFGAWMGASVGALTWLVYGTLNPYGFSLPILGATVLGEALYGVAGGAVRGFWGTTKWRPDARLAVAGFLLTFIYDIFTNVVSALTVGVPIAVSLVGGVPFALAHEVSNAAFFCLGFPPLATSISKVMEAYVE